MGMFEVLLISALFAHRMALDIASSREFSGPFGLYAPLREFLRSSWMPEFVREGVECPYCVGFSAGIFAALVLVYDPTRLFAVLIVGIAASALPALVYQVMESLHGIAARDF